MIGCGVNVWDPSGSYEAWLVRSIGAAAGPNLTVLDIWWPGRRWTFAGGFCTSWRGLVSGWDLANGAGTGPAAGAWLGGAAALDTTGNRFLSCADAALIAWANTVGRAHLLWCAQKGLNPGPGTTRYSPCLCNTANSSRLELQGISNDGIIRGVAYSAGGVGAPAGGPLGADGDWGHQAFWNGPGAATQLYFQGLNVAGGGLRQDQTIAEFGVGRLRTGGSTYYRVVTVGPIILGHGALACNQAALSAFVASQGYPTGVA